MKLKLNGCLQVPGHQPAGRRPELSGGRARHRDELCGALPERVQAADRVRLLDVRREVGRQLLPQGRPRTGQADEGRSLGVAVSLLR